MNENEQKEQTTQTTLATAAEAIDVSSLVAPAPAQSPTGGADPRDAEIAELKHRLEVESAEQGRLRKANDELRKLQDENARLKAENAKLSVRSPGDYLTDEERAILDDKQLAAIDKVARGRINDAVAEQRAESDRLREELQKRDASMAASARAQFNAEVERIAPGLAALVAENRDAWHKWSSDRRRAASVSQAFASYDAGTVAEFLNEFVKSNGIRANGGGVAARPSTSFSPTGGSRPVMADGDTATYTLEQYNAEMRRASDELNAGRITTDEYRAIKRKFDTALQEGRIVQR